MKICIFGSSFNPPHIAHMQIVEGLKKMNFDQLLLMPTGLPNHKKIDITNEDRVLLVEAFGKLCDVQVTYHEIENNFRYTVESLQFLNFPKDVEIYFTIGSDSVNTLLTWDFFDELKELVTFVVVKRPGVAMNQEILKQIKYLPLEIETTDISSTKLRADATSEYIPKPIFDIIISKHLYNS